MPASPLKVGIPCHYFNPFVTVIRAVLGDRKCNLVWIAMIAVVCRLEAYSCYCVLDSLKVKQDPCVLVLRVILKELFVGALSIA